jgi:polyhydroxyalkanoate synthase
MANPPNDPAQLLASLLEGGQAMLRPFGPFGMPSPTELGKSDPMGNFIAATQRIADVQQEFWKQGLAYWSAAPSAAAGVAQVPSESADSDRRFSAEAWRNDPRFDLIRRSYLAYSNFLQNTVESAQIDEKTKAQMRYGMRQFIDAMSPSNFLVTNPEALQLAAETGGKSLTEGMNLFFEDMANGRVSSTDEKAYEVGKNLATTPGAVIFENDLIQVIQYTPTIDQVYERPLLLVPPAINKFYILDLQPENSFVRYALDQGHTVFLLSWRNIDASLGHLSWDDYLEQGIMRAIDVALDVTRADQVNTLGFCVGGTLLASALAVLAAKDEHPVSSMTLLTTMLDFTDTGEIGSLVTEQSLAAREAAIGNGGLMQGKELAGQERATGAAGISAGRFEQAGYLRVLSLATAQDAYFAAFAATATASQNEFFARTIAGPVIDVLAKMRQIVQSGGLTGEMTGSTANLVERNSIYSLTSATNSTTAEVNGIRVAGGTTIYRNNMIAIGAGLKQLSLSGAVAAFTTMLMYDAPDWPPFATVSGRA